MGLRDKIKTYFDRSREKHKLTFIDDSTYQEKWSFRVSSFNLISLLGLYTIIIIVSLFSLVKYTGLKSVFTGNNAYENEIALHSNRKLIDSLYATTRANELYLNDLREILNGGMFQDSSSNFLGDTLENYTPDFSKNESDSILRAKIESNLAAGISNHQTTTSLDFFFTPVNGLVSHSFDKEKGHFGVDIVTLADEPIKACLEGRIVLTGWTQAEGQIVVIQHRGDLLTIYKHCSSILKKRGDFVQTGDPVAIVGNSGELTSGPHLHFEMWKNGQVLDPEEYISFK